MEKKRCGWVTNDPLYIDYHDNEWGVPNRDTQHLFEMICLEGQQAGLSWITILKKRVGYRKAYFNFDANKIAQFSDDDIERLLLNTEIVRNKLKIKAIISNAQAFNLMQENGENFSDFIWSFLPETPFQRYTDYREFPTQTHESEQMSKELKKRGFRFVGPTTCYAFMQAVGIVDDHSADCFCVKNKAIK